MPSPMERAQVYASEGRTDYLAALKLDLEKANEDYIRMYDRNNEVISFCADNIPETEGNDAPEQPKEVAPKKKSSGKKGGTSKQS